MNDDIQSRVKLSVGEAEAARATAPRRPPTHPHIYLHLPPGTGTSIALLSRRRRALAWLRFNLWRRFS